MIIIQKHLPSFCYANRPLIKLMAVVVHFFSGRWQFPDDRFNMQKCWNLFHDLNLPIEKRLYYKMADQTKPPYGSAKYLIGLEQTWQLVPDNKEQYHAGTSEWIIGSEKLVSMNKYSDGIEIVNDGVQAYNEYQMKMLVWILQNKYPQLKLKIGANIGPILDSAAGPYRPVYGSEIVGHSQVSPGRKVDPGKNLDWARVQNMLAIKNPA